MNKREGLNIGTFPAFKMHNIGTVPTFKMHNIGTVPMYKMHNVGTQNFIIFLVGTSFGWSCAKLMFSLCWIQILVWSKYFWKIKECDPFDYFIVKSSLHWSFVIFALFNLLRYFHKTGNGIITMWPYILLSLSVVHWPS